MGKSPYCAAAILLALLCCGGCSMCHPCELETYSAYGGRWQRTDRAHGRVGSVFAPAGALVPYDDPVGSAVDPDVPGDLPPAAPDQEDAESPDDVPSDGEQDESVLEDAERQREERARRLRELELEDIRYQRPSEGQSPSEVD